MGRPWLSSIWLRWGLLLSATVFFLVAMAFYQHQIFVKNGSISCGSAARVALFGPRHGGERVVLRDPTDDPLCQAASKPYAEKGSVFMAIAVIALIPSAVGFVRARRRRAELVESRL